MQRKEAKMSAVQTITSFENLADTKSMLLTTFRRDGTPVATPVCHVVEDGIVYTTTMDGTGKVKRIRNEARVTIGACDMRGNPTGPAFAGTARLVSDEEIRQARKLKKSRLIGTVFATSARAHWLVKPMQIYERLRFRHRFVGIAIEPLPATDLPRGQS
jgi:uncharacterized protein